MEVAQDACALEVIEIEMGGQLRRAGTGEMARPRQGLEKALVVVTHNGLHMYYTTEGVKKILLSLVSIF